MKRQFLNSLLLLALTSSAAAQGYADGVISHVDIFNTSMREGVTCFRIPALVTAPNGDLIAAIDERITNYRDLIDNDNINLAIRRSSDNGVTWSDIEIVVDFPLGESASDPSMVVDESTGEIFMFYNFIDLVNARREFYLHYVKSSDNGVTWSEPVDITSQIAKAEWQRDFKFITSGRGYYTSDGKIIHTLVNLKNGLHIFGSDDHGESWYLIDTPIRPADESKIIELFDGRWMVNSRVNKAGIRYVHTSEDQGKSWVTKADSVLVDPSCNASIIRYTAKVDGYDRDRLLFVNAASSEARKDLSIRVSYDQGESWSAPKLIYEGEAAYSSMSKLHNGDIAIFFERDDYTHNDVVVVSLEWLTEGKDRYKAPRRRSRRR